MSGIDDMTVDVVVVGAGAAGSAAAWALARQGSRVVLLERFEDGHGRGSSHGTERIVRLVYPDDAYVAFAQEALPLWRRLQSEANETLLTTTGGVDVGPAETIEELAAACTRRHVRHQVLTVAEAAHLAPGIALERLGDLVLHQPDGAAVHADETLRALRRLSALDGAVVRFDDPVLAVDVHHDEVVVHTARGALRADTIVVTSGAWAQPIVDMCAVPGLVLPPIEVTQEQVAFFDVRDRDVRWPVFIAHERPDELSVYGLPTPDGRIKIGEHGTGPVVDPDDRGFDPIPETWDRLIGWAVDHLPGVVPTPAGHLTCLYASGPDERFLLDRVGRVVVGVGLGGHGFKFTPAIGQRLANLARLGHWGDEHHPDEPNPFALPSP